MENNDTISTMIPLKAIVIYGYSEREARDHNYYATIEDINSDGETTSKVLTNMKDLRKLKTIIDKMVETEGADEGFIGFLPPELLAVKITSMQKDLCFVTEPFKHTLKVGKEKHSGWFPRLLWTVRGGNISIHSLKHDKYNMKQKVYTFPMPHNNGESMCTGNVSIDKLKTVKHIDDAINRIVKGVLEGKITHSLNGQFKEKFEKSRKTGFYDITNSPVIRDTLKDFLVWKGFTV